MVLHVKNRLFGGLIHDALIGVWCAVNYGEIRNVHVLLAIEKPKKRQLIDSVPYNLCSC